MDRPKAAVPETPTANTGEDAEEDAGGDFAKSEVADVGAT